MKYFHISTCYHIMPKFLESLFENQHKVAGRTMILDRLAYPAETINALDPSFNITVKIGWGIPYLLDRKVVVDRVSRYRSRGFNVSNGGTLLEIAYSKGRHMEALHELASAGFNTLEISEGVLDIPERIKRDLVDEARSLGMKLHLEVGRKNPTNQFSLDETVERMSRMLDFSPDTVIIEGRETGRNVEIYDANGSIKWDWVNRIVKEFDKHDIMFEAPIETQQAELVIRLGADVNLGNVSLGSAFALTTQRLGFRGDTFGIEEYPGSYQGSPASKFILHVLATSGPLDQLRIMEITGMNRRTVQNSLDSLISGNMVKSSSDLRDMRKKIYSLKSTLTQKP